MAGSNINPLKPRRQLILGYVFDSTCQLALHFKPNFLLRRVHNTLGKWYVCRCNELWKA